MIRRMSSGWDPLVADARAFLSGQRQRSLSGASGTTAIADLLAAHPLAEVVAGLSAHAGVGHEVRACMRPGGCPQAAACDVRLWHPCR